MIKENVQFKKVKYDNKPNNKQCIMECSINNIIYWGDNLAISDYWVGLGYIPSLYMVVMALVL